MLGATRHLSPRVVATEPDSLTGFGMDSDSNAARQVSTLLTPSRPSES